MDTNFHSGVALLHRKQRGSRASNETVVTQVQPIVFGAFGFLDVINLGC